MNKLFKLLAALFAASSITFAAVGISGFADLSYDDGDQNIELDEIELRLSLDAEGPVTGNANLSMGEAGDVTLEQAYVDYALTSGATVTVGQFESTLGFDAYDADGLIANGAGLSVTGDVYDQGVRYTTGNLAVTVGESVNLAGDDNLDGDNHVVEVSYSKAVNDQLNAFVGFRSNEATGNDIFNAYVTYDVGALTLIGEVFQDDNDDTDGNQIAAVYGYSDNSSITVRSASTEDLNGTIDTNTIAHATALTDDLAFIIDVTETDGDTVQGQGGTNTTLELLYTF